MKVVVVQISKCRIRNVHFAGIVENRQTGGVGVVWSSVSIELGAGKCTCYSECVV